MRALPALLRNLAAEILIALNSDATTIKKTYSNDWKKIRVIEGWIK